MPPLKLVHFSDILCVWAYVGQAPLLRLAERFGDHLDIDVHYCSVFPDTQTKITQLWRDKGSFEGYARHVRDVAKGFDGIEIHEDVWSKTRPFSSASPQLFIKAVELLEENGDMVPFQSRLSVKAAKILRSSFFADGQDISDWAIQRDVSEQIGVAFEDVCKRIETGEAMARLAFDYEQVQTMGVKGSPTYILNNGRQILFGNISYGILEANLTELLKEQDELNASFC
ncbi:DsbA family protein [Yoonia sp.]|uniref:DsbA family oxidoreductase n=1 Tax=Yoonia sp. TaxID=2212373 RepID=UPI0023B59A5A